MRNILPFAVLSAVSLSCPSFAEFDLESLLAMPLDSLADTKVVSATRNAQSLSDVAASVYVISAKEIERSGVRSVADALALAPGLHVAKFSNYDWGITARGQNKPLSNTLLVMVDGRSVFNPMFSGVDWDLIPISLANIAQIEVVLGPVGTIWGGNATNGVINIISKEAEKAPKGKLTVKEGNYNYSEYQFHDSTAIGDYAHLSGYLEYVDHMPWTSEQEIVQSQQHYNVNTERFGTRLDYQKFANTLSVQAGGIRSREDYMWVEYLPHPTIAGAYSGDFYDTEMTMQEYFAGLQHIYDFQDGDSWDNKVWLTYSDNDGPDRNASFWRFDLDSHYTIAELWGTQLSLGSNIRIIDEQLGKYSAVDQYSMTYLRVTDEHDFLSQSYALYANWEIPLDDKTHLTVGNRWQYHNLTDEIYAQPQVRLSYQLSDEQRLWAGWGLSVVTPSRLEMETTFQRNYYGYIKPVDDVFYYVGSDLLAGNDNMDVEKIETFELGYRLWKGNAMQLSISTYYSRHDNIRAGLFLEKIPNHNGAINGLFLSQYDDPLWSETMGGEVALKWRPLPDVQLNTNYSYKRIVGHCKGALCAGSDAAKRQLENQPNHFFNAQVIWDINPQWWVSSTLHYVSKSSPHPDYTTKDGYAWPEVVNVDASASWQMHKRAPRISASVENLTTDQSKEFPDSLGAFQNGTQYWLTLEWTYGAAQE